MDTPEKNQTSSSFLPSFEDSPVYNFLNSLSPIKAVKSTHIAHTFNSISFPSLPSIFTSPHISPHKELKSPRRQKQPVSPFKDETTVSGNEGRVTVMNRLQEIYVPEASTLKQPKNVEVSSEKDVMEDEGKLDMVCQIEKITNKEAEVDWESSISDAELLIFSSSISSGDAELIQKPYPKTGFELKNIQQSQDNLSFVNSNELVTVNYEKTDKAENSHPFCIQPISNLQRGVRRRCLNFETVGKLDRTTNDGSNHGSSQSNERQFVSLTSGISFQCTLPGIGLHLNVLTNKHLNSENMSSERQFNLPSFSAPSYTTHPSEEHLWASNTSQRESGTEKNEVPMDEAASPHLHDEELNQINPRKDRQCMENGSKNGACKRCNCKKSRCLKLYCECFAAGVYCIEPCSCQECFNKPKHKDIVLETRKQIESRNPLAFAPKVIVNSDFISELGDDSNKTPASARHKRGCNCKKSNCLKKYCECYQGGVGCSNHCRCEGCKNAFGRKLDEQALTGNETKQPEEERETCQLKSPELQNDEDRSCGSLVPRPIQLKRKLPSSFRDEGPSANLSSVRFKLEKQSIIQTNPKLYESNTIETDNIPEIPCTDCSSGIGIKNISPNSKRINLPPPRDEHEPSPSSRISRRLILQSVPSLSNISTGQNSWLNKP